MFTGAIADLAQDSDSAESHLPGLYLYLSADLGWVGVFSVFPPYNSYTSIWWLRLACCSWYAAVGLFCANRWTRWIRWEHCGECPWSNWRIAGCGGCRRQSWHLFGCERRHRTFCKHGRHGLLHPGEAQRLPDWDQVCLQVWQSEVEVQSQIGMGRTLPPKWQVHCEQDQQLWRKRSTGNCRVFPERCGRQWTEVCSVCGEQGQKGGQQAGSFFVFGF